MPHPVIPKKLQAVSLSFCVRGQHEEKEFRQLVKQEQEINRERSRGETIMRLLRESKERRDR